MCPRPYPDPYSSSLDAGLNAALGPQLPAASSGPPALRHPFVVLVVLHLHF